MSLTRIVSCGIWHRIVVYRVLLELSLKLLNEDEHRCLYRPSAWLRLFFWYSADEWLSLYFGA